MYFDQRWAGHQQMIQAWVDSLNQGAKETRDFRIATWRNSAMWNKGKGYPLPPIPEMMPAVVEVDWDVAKKEFIDADNGIINPPSWMRYKRIDVPDGSFELEPKPKPQLPGNVNRPIGRPDQGAGRGFFTNVGGPSFHPGALWNDPETDLDYRLVELRESPFNPGFKPQYWGLIGVAVLDGVPVK